MWENQDFLTLQTFIQEIFKNSCIIKKCLLSLLQIIIWANCTFWFCSKRMFHSWTDEIFSHLFWDMLAWFQPYCLTSFFGLLLVTVQTSLFLLPPIIRMDPFFLCLVYTSDRQGQLTSRRATKAITSSWALGGSQQPILRINNWAS